jgi:O-antigen/teichoic acid export membrane protein
MRLGKNLLIYAIADVIAKSMALLASPFMTRLLTPEEYGSLGLLAAVWTLVALFQFGGMEMACQIFLSKETDDLQRRAILTTATLVATASLMVVWGLFSFAALSGPWLENYTKVSRTQLAWYLTGLAPTVLISWYLYLLRFRHKAIPFARTNLLSKALWSLILICVLYLIPPRDRLTMLFVVTCVIQGLVWVWALRELKLSGLWPYSRASFSSDLARNMFKFGVSFIPGAATYAAVVSADRLIVGWFAGPAETAIIQLALNLGSVALMFKMWFSLVWDPNLVEWLATKNPSVYVPKLQLVLMGLSATFFPLVWLSGVWGDVFVHFLYPSSYMPVVRLLPVIILIGACSTVALVAIATITLDPSPVYYFAVYIFALIITVCVGLSTVPRLGALGAILGTLSAESFILVCWILRGNFILKNLNLNWRPVFALGGVSGIFILLYRPGVILGQQIFWERMLMTLVIFGFVAGFGHRIVKRNLPGGWHQLWHVCEG